MDVEEHAQLIERAIRKLVREFRMLPREINAGLCADFQHAVWEELGKPDWIETVDDENLRRAEENIPNGQREAETASWYSHTFMRVNGLYYDSECPLGVVMWRDLPFFNRRMQSNGHDTRRDL